MDPQVKHALALLVLHHSQQSGKENVQTVCSIERHSAVHSGVVLDPACEKWRDNPFRTEGSQPATHEEGNCLEEGNKTMTVDKQAISWVRCHPKWQSSAKMVIFSLNERLPFCHKLRKKRSIDHIYLIYDAWLIRNWCWRYSGIATRLWSNDRVVVADLTVLAKSVAEWTNGPFSFIALFHAARRRRPSYKSKRGKGANGQDL